MSPLTIAVIGVSFVAALILTGAVRRVALSYRILDIPNQRSSHTTPTPRGGGLAIVGATTLALVGFYSIDQLDVDVLIASLAGLAVAGVGFLDDRYGVPAGVRFSAHLLAAVWTVAWLGGVPNIRLGAETVELGWVGYVLGPIAVVWVVNLFNFMDGIDAIAASECAFIATCGAALGILSGGCLSAGPLALAAACCGFLCWNWPPAKIFMGDVGSGYLGFMIALFALTAARSSDVAIWVWLILGGVFFADATVALFRRLARGEKVYMPHRTHAYQRLALRFRSHRAVTLTVLVVNLAWLLPLAFLSTAFPAFSAWFALAGLVPLAAVVYLIGSGSAESPTAKDAQ